VQGEPWEKNRTSAVLSTIQILFFDAKNVLHKLPKKRHAQPKGEINFMPQKTAHPSQKNNGPTLNFLTL